MSTTCQGWLPGLPRYEAHERASSPYRREACRYDSEPYQFTLVAPAIVPDPAEGTKGSETARNRSQKTQERENTP